VSGAGDPNTLPEMEPTEFIRVVEDAIVTALTNPILPEARCAAHRVKRLMLQIGFTHNLIL
jgi:hypothetical protein